MADRESWSAPPVEEMGIGVVFHQLNQLNGPTYGLFWSEIQQQFPMISSQPARPAFVEGAVKSPMGATLMFAATELPQRYSFFDEGKRNAVALQRDVLAKIWNRRGERETYPKYHDHLRSEFLELWERFVRFVEKQRVGPVKPRQCEVTYLDLIPRGRGWEDLGELNRVLKPWCGCTENPLPNPDAVSIQCSYPMEGLAGHVVMSVSQQPRAWDSVDSLVLNFASRVLLPDEDMSRVPEFLDVAHAWALRVFDAVMADDVKALWR